MKTFKFLSLIFSLFTFSGLFAQEQFVLKSGKITYEISYVDDRMDDQQKAMMPTESIMYFKGHKTRVEVSMAMGKTSIISDNKLGKSTVLMDFMGNKLAMETTHNEAKKEIQKNGGFKVDQMDGNKKIAGYDCKNARITQIQKGKEYSFEVWYTDELGINNAKANGIEGIDGCMLEYEMIQNGMHMRMTTKSISSEEVGDAKFEIPDGYERTTQEGLKSLMGGGNVK